MTISDSSSSEVSLGYWKIFQASKQARGVTSLLLFYDVSLAYIKLVSFTSSVGASYTYICSN